MLSRCVVVTWLLLLTSCYHITEHVQVEYQSPGKSSTPSVPSDKRVPVEVRVSDERGADKRLLSKTGPYGDEAAPIYASNDVPKLIQDALETELGKRGFVIGPAGVVVSVELVRLRGEIRPHWTYGHTAKADMILSVLVRRPDGLGVFSHTFTGNGSERGMQGGDIAKAAVDQALTAAITAMVNEKVFLESLVTASQTGSN